MRLVQLTSGDTRRVALVEEPNLRLLREVSSVYALALAAIERGGQLTRLVADLASDEKLLYDQVYAGTSLWQLMPPFDHPEEAARCLVSGTGLTHRGSAQDRASMHTPSIQTAGPEQLTDSMKMFQWGVEAGRPARGQIGVAPEWFYKGYGEIVQAPGAPLVVPSYAEDGGEEAEIAVLYVVGADGRPYRVGMAQGNEFSDHRFEKRNYLNLAGSKLRTCAIGPELVVNPAFHTTPGRVRILRQDAVYWSQSIASGEDEMVHSLRNMEHHHFKFELHRRPGDVHIHFLGAHSLSFGQGVALEDGDVMEISFDGFGRPLRNPMRVVEEPDQVIEVVALV